MNSKEYYKQLKILKDKYRKIFNHINSENYFDNLSMRLELDKIKFEYNEFMTRYFINEKVNNINYTVTFGKIKMLNNKIRFYLYITTDYSIILELKKDINKK